MNCDVCAVEVRGEDLEGCESCGRFFGPCCNSVQDGRCVDCVDPDFEADQ